MIFGNGNKLLEQKFVISQFNGHNAMITLCYKKKGTFLCDQQIFNKTFSITKKDNIEI